MRFFKITGITLMCCLADGIARSFLPGWGGSMSWLYYTMLILFVGDIFYYAVFAIAFELVNKQLQHQRSAKLSIFIGSTLALICFMIFGSLRFWTNEQRTIMSLAYGIIGCLYGYLYYKWVGLIQQ